MAEHLYTYQELAEQFNVHRETLRRWFLAFKIKRFSPTHSTVRFPASEIERFKALKTRFNGTNPKPGARRAR